MLFWINNISNNSLVHFPRMKKVIGENVVDLNLFVTHLKKLLKQFESRFQQFSIIEPVVTFYLNPFNAHTDVTLIADFIAKMLQEEASKIEEEILKIQNDIILKSNELNESIWNLAAITKYPLLKKGAYKIKSCFGSTYLCESLFSTMNIIKSKTRSRLTNVNLDDCLRLGLSTYTPNFEKLVSEMHCQSSH